ncbi:mannose-1-phosphate guanylyltransferase/mannose-6-phosphate isomerase [Thalassococcus sp. S3]|uniref:mannose-1-phosphate guanylyltransferase/mannose-6-phosphate isomerase n=1 Tax=Thalassococcus sp. S3 TaxID=2017482 RepID=UPI001024925D|nr:mannose-1-phosphate guanylyltransferase/mannose-6-phosphate isomerase [Thalassococcus sp. S3]QBF34239.1 mannose-1-phosphate guanylyltransferase/mannose-6-phosphate isomerase [Thalassococcus sp. S3]
MIVPILLCGGSGTRLWPLSRKSYPKQFVPLVGEGTLFQASVERLSGAAFAPPLVLTGDAFRFIVAEQLDEIGVTPSAILIEPEARNTAPAILAAALYLQASQPDAVMLVAPSDHVIPQSDAFQAAAARGLALAQAGRIVTFGITPVRPETGYGYLELAEAPGEDAADLVRFVEKPDHDRAAEMLATGRYLWNAGIFMFSVSTLVRAYEAHAPDLVPGVRDAVAQASTDLSFVRLAPAPWEGLDDVSIDYAVMEKAEALSVIPFDAGWSDLGDWASVQRELQAGPDGVAQSGPVTALDCHNSLLRSESENLELVGIGLTDIVAVATPDAVLVADASRAQDVRQAVTALKAKEARQATDFPRDHRPWGHFETLALSDRFQVKRIVVKPGAALSLQSHFHRSEHWIVVQGTARVTIDDEVRLVTENQSVYIPLGAVHRMENPGKVEMVLIEVQTGSYLGEDDIVRYEDIYARQ